jgi:hypothetical protein
MAAEDVAAHAVADEAVGGLAGELQPAGHQRALAGGQEEEPEDEDGYDDGLQHRLGDAELHLLAEELERAPAADGREVEVGRPRRMELLGTDAGHSHRAHRLSCLASSSVLLKRRKVM